MFQKVLFYNREIPVDQLCLAELVWHLSGFVPCSGLLFTEKTDKMHTCACLHLGREIQVQNHWVAGILNTAQGQVELNKNHTTINQTTVHSYLQSFLFYTQVFIKIQSLSDARRCCFTSLCNGANVSGTCWLINWKSMQICAALAISLEINGVHRQETQTHSGLPLRLRDSRNE